MTPLALDQIGLRWHHHLSALWWLGLLYRRPKQFGRSLESLNKSQAVRAGMMLYLHALPYIVLLSILGRWLIFGILDLESVQSSVFGNRPAIVLDGLFVILGIGVTAFLGLILALSEWVDKRIILYSSLILSIVITFLITEDFFQGVILGIYYGLILSWFFLLFGGIAGGLIFTVTFGILFSIAGLSFSGTGFGIAEGGDGKLIKIFPLLIIFSIALPIMSFKDDGSIKQEPIADKGRIISFLFFIFILGSLLGMSSGEPVMGMIMAGLFCMIFTRAFYYPFHLFFVFPTIRERWYPWHPVVWDDLCFLPFIGMDRLLVAYTEYAPEAAHQEIDRLIDHYPSQRMAALWARTRLIARASAQESNLSRLDTCVAQLPVGNQGILVQIPKVQEMVGEISRLQTHLNNLDRAFLRPPIAALLVKKIRSFQDQIARLPKLLANEFGQAACQWLRIAENQYHQIQSASFKTALPIPFRSDGSIDPNQAAFVPREGVISDLKRQLVPDTEGHALLVQGHSIGKSTLLLNLQDFLPSSLHAAAISMKDLASCHSQDFVSMTVQQTTKPILPSWLDFPVLAYPTLPEFEHWLSCCNIWLVEMNRHLMLVIDGYEILDHSLSKGLSKGGFDPDLMTVISRSIQNHPRLIWCFAGNSPVSELTNHLLASCLTGARTLEIPPFTIDETRQLLTEPMRHSRLWAEDDPERPRFDPSFWGEGGIERIHAEAGGWPHGVQWLAETIVGLCNDREQCQVDADLLEHALDKTIVAGETALRELLQPKDAAPACITPTQTAEFAGFHRAILPLAQTPDRGHGDTSPAPAS